MQLSPATRAALSYLVGLAAGVFSTWLVLNGELRRLRFDVSICQQRQQLQDQGSRKHENACPCGHAVPLDSLPDLLIDDQGFLRLGPCIPHDRFDAVARDLAAPDVPGSKRADDSGSRVHENLSGRIVQCHADDAAGQRDDHSHRDGNHFHADPQARPAIQG